MLVYLRGYGPVFTQVNVFPEKVLNGQLILTVLVWTNLSKILAAN